MSIGATLGGYYANWFKYGAEETINKYLGIKFTIGINAFHYGWIRCDVKDEGRTLIIKDYAYESSIDYPIIAGDTIHFTEVESSQNNDINIYSYQETLYVNLKDSAKASVALTNLAGQHIFTYETSELTSTFDMTNVASGIYIVTVEFKNNVFSKKVLIQ